MSYEKDSHRGYRPPMVGGIPEMPPTNAAHMFVAAALTGATAAVVSKAMSSSIVPMDPPSTDCLRRPGMPRPPEDQIKAG